MDLVAKGVNPEINTLAGRLFPLPLPCWYTRLFPCRWVWRRMSCSAAHLGNGVGFKDRKRLQHNEPNYPSVSQSGFRGNQDYSSYWSRQGAEKKSGDLIVPSWYFSHCPTSKMSLISDLLKREKLIAKCLAVRFYLRNFDVEFSPRTQNVSAYTPKGCFSHLLC